MQLNSTHILCGGIFIVIGNVLYCDVFGTSLVLLCTSTLNGVFAHTFLQKKYFKCRNRRKY